MWLNLQILLVLLLIHYIDLLRVEENKMPVEATYKSTFCGYFANAKAERVTQATPTRQVGDPVRCINI